MTAPISVVIPTLNVSDRIGPCLGALGEGLFAGLIHEVILTDGGSSDEIETIAENTGAKLIRAERGRGTQLAAGARTATGSDWLLFLHADTVLSPDWPLAVRQHIQTSREKAACFRLRFDSDAFAARAVEQWANLRSTLFSLPYGDQGLLIRRRLYEEIGGYPEIPLMEDVAIVRALGRRRIRVLNCTATTSAERYERDGWLWRGARNLMTLARYRLGAKPEDLSRHYEQR